MQAAREDFGAMAGRCREQLHRALDAFWTGSKEEMASVEAADGEIDADEKSLDALVLRVLALRQPVASDLRTFTVLFKLVTDLERIGDEAVEIARRNRAHLRRGGAHASPPASNGRDLGEEF